MENSEFQYYATGEAVLQGDLVHHVSDADQIGNISHTKSYSAHESHRVVFWAHGCEARLERIGDLTFIQRAPK